MFFERLKEWRLVIWIAVIFMVGLSFAFAAYRDLSSWDRFIKQAQESTLINAMHKSNKSNFTTIASSISRLDNFEIWPFKMNLSKIFVFNCKSNCVANGHIWEKIQLNATQLAKMKPEKWEAFLYIIPWKRTIEPEWAYMIQNNDVKELDSWGNLIDIKYHSSGEVKPFEHISAWLKWFMDRWYYWIWPFEKSKEAREFQTSYFWAKGDVVEIGDKRWIVTVEIAWWFEEDIAKLLDKYTEIHHNYQPPEDNGQTQTPQTQEVDVIFTNGVNISAEEQGNMWFNEEGQPNQAYIKYKVLKNSKLWWDKVPPIDADGFFLIWYIDQECTKLYKPDEHIFDKNVNMIYGKKSLFKVSQIIVEGQTGYVIDDFISPNTSNVSIEIPETLYGIPILKIGLNAFRDKGISTLRFPYFSHVKIIDEWAFADNTIRHVSFPNSVKQIKKGAFQNNLITTIDFHIDSSIELIDDKAFQYNTITQIKFPASLKKIWISAFENNSLTKIIFRAGSLLEEIWDSAFRWYNSSDPNSANQASNKLFLIQSENVLQRSNDPSKWYLIWNNTLPKKLKKIGKRAFENNYLWLIYYNPTNQSFWDNPNQYESILKNIKNNSNNINFNKHKTNIGKPPFIFNNQSTLLYSSNSLKLINYDNEYDYLKEIGEGAFANNYFSYIYFYPSYSAANNNKCKLDLYFNERDWGAKDYYYNSYKAYNDIKAEAFMNNFLQDELVLPSTVKRIWKKAFAHNVIKNIVFIPENLRKKTHASFEYIDDEAFKDNLISSFEVLNLDNLKERYSHQYYHNTNGVMIPTNVKYWDLLQLYYENYDHQKDLIELQEKLEDLKNDLNKAKNYLQSLEDQIASLESNKPTWWEEQVTTLNNEKNQVIAKIAWIETSITNLNTSIATFNTPDSFFTPWSNHICWANKPLVSVKKQYHTYNNNLYDLMPINKNGYDPLFWKKVFDKNALRCVSYPAKDDNERNTYKMFFNLEKNQLTINEANKLNWLPNLVMVNQWAYMPLKWTSGYQWSVNTPFFSVSPLVYQTLLGWTFTNIPDGSTNLVLCNPMYWN